MPELPEVETYRRYFEETCLYQPISDVYVEDTKLLTTDYDTLVQQLRNRQFIGTKRVGKNLFARLDAPYWLHFHFGMTGDLAYFKDDDDFIISLLPNDTHHEIVLYKNSTENFKTFSEMLQNSNFKIVKIVTIDSMIEFTDSCGGVWNVYYDSSVYSTIGAVMAAGRAIKFLTGC